MTWTPTGNGNEVLDDKKGKVFLSYNSNYIANRAFSDLDSANPETAIVLIKDKKNGHNRYLIFRGDRRKELEPMYPDIERLKDYWKKEGGHFWSDSLDNE